MISRQQSAVVVVHHFVSSAARRLVQDWTTQTYPGASIVGLRDEWSATPLDDESLVVPVSFETDAIGLAQIVMGVPATVGAFRQVFHTADNGDGSFEEFVTRAVTAVGSLPGDD